MPMVFEVPREIEERVSLWSGKSNETPDVLMRRAIEQYLEDLEDYEDAVRISEAVSRGEEKVHTSEEVRRHLGLERQLH